MKARRANRRNERTLTGFGRDGAVPTQGSAGAQPWAEGENPFRIQPFAPIAGARNAESAPALSPGLRSGATLGFRARNARTLKGFSRRGAFTLIEMLTVLAITAVLLTIIVLPIFQSFNLTRAAEAFADAQDQGRYLTEKIAREIGESVSVRPTNNLVPTTFNVAYNAATNASIPNSSVIVQVPSQNGVATNIQGPNGYLAEVVLPYTKLDFVPPAEGQDPKSIGAPGSGFKDPVSGKFDPTLKAPKGQPATPVVPSMSLVRYAVGLRNPLSQYNDPYTGLLMARAGGRDNLFVLFRMACVPYIVTGTGKQVNTALFAADANGNAVLDDPRFLVPDWNDSTTPPSLEQDDHNLRLYHWLGQIAPWEGADPIKDNTSYFAHSVIQTEVSRYDMIMPQYNQANRQVRWDTVTIPGGGTMNLPRLTPMVQFRPTLISNDPTAGQEALRPGEESDSAPMIGPDTYKTEYGLWNNAIVRTFPAGYTPLSSSNNTENPYVIGYTGLNAPGFGEYYYNPANGGEFNSGYEFFDNYTYNNVLSTGGMYPFTQAAVAANTNPTLGGWMGQNQVYSSFTPYNVLSGPGKIVASFDISEVGVNSLPNDPDEDANRPNLPTMWLQGGGTGYTGPYSVNNDPNWNAATSAWTATVPWSPLGTILWTPINNTVANPYDMNEAFNQTWYTYQDLQSGAGVQRFIDLRAVPNEDGTYGPLYPAGAGQGPANSVTGFEVQQPDGSMMNRCHIVPGSEIVYGPDQKSGPNYGHLIRYSRTTRAPGPDQYKINYTDQREPNDPGNDNLVTVAAYQNVLGLTAAEVTGFNPDVYNPNNFCSAQIQPRYKVGYLQLNSDPNLPLPNGYTTTGPNPTFTPVQFQVEYRFQFTGTIPSYIANQLPAGTGTTDVFDVDYDTRQLMQVLLTIRNYPQSDLPNPQSVTLKSTATIRNLAH